MLTIVFADDTSISIQGNNIHEMEIAMNSEIKRLSIWLKIKNISLNKKTHTMTFRNMKGIRERKNDIYIDDIKLTL